MAAMLLNDEHKRYVLSAYTVILNPLVNNDHVLVSMIFYLYMPNNNALFSSNVFTLALVKYFVYFIVRWIWISLFMQPFLVHPLVLD